MNVIKNIRVHRNTSYNGVFLIFCLIFGGSLASHGRKRHFDRWKKVLGKYPVSF